MSDLPRHKFWGAGELDCPPDLKASNGELCRMRCRVCGDGWRKSRDVCLAARAPMPVERIAMLWNSLPLETDPQSVIAFARAIERFHGIQGSADPESAVVGAATWGPDHPDWNATHGCTHECRSGAECRCATEATAPTLPHPALDRANAGERESEAKPALWQFRYVFADGRRGNWHCGLEFPRTINTGDSAGHGTTFEVRELFPAADPERTGRSGRGDRPSSEPGGCVCETCGRVFIGSEWHTECAECAAASDHFAGEDRTEVIVAERIAVDPERREGAEGVALPDAIEKLRRCTLGCGVFGQCKATMHGKPSECAGGVPIPHTFAPPDADTGDRTDGGKNGR